MEDKMELNGIEQIARSVIYKHLYEALQEIIDSGVTSEQANGLLSECIRQLLNSQEITTFLDGVRYRNPLETKQNLAKYLQDKGLWMKK
jgi:hypothetical protein